MKQFYFLNANDGLITRNLHIFSPPPLYATSAVYRHFMQLDAHFRRFEQQSAKRRMSGSHWASLPVSPISWMRTWAIGYEQ